MERTITVNKEKCIRCGLCIKDCFIGCLGFNEDKIPSYLPGMAKSQRQKLLAQV